MKRSEIQQRLSTAAKTVATKFENGSLKADPRPSSSVVLTRGAPVNALGFVLKQAGLAGPRTDLNGNLTALAKVLGTSNEILPVKVIAAVGGLQMDYYGSKPTPKGRRAQLVKPLRAFAAAINAETIRKTYTRSTPAYIGSSI